MTTQTRDIMPKLKRLLICLTTCLAAVRLPAGPADSALPTTAVRFSTSDAKLQSLYDVAEQKEARNIVQFTPTLKVLVEGAQYQNAWLETQPMGGEMYAQRNVRVALNNQLIFLLAQRADGRLPGMVTATALTDASTRAAKPSAAEAWLPGPELLASYGWIQGFCFPDPAWRMYFWIGKDRAYLQRLSKALAAFDGYLWRTRDSNGDGVLETWCVWDTGEDNSTRYLTRNAPTQWPFDFPPGDPRAPDPQDPASFQKYWSELAGRPAPTRSEVLAPFDSMDFMAYSYDARATLAKISRELGDGREAFWQAQANEVRRRLVAKLWDPERHACFDHDRTGRKMSELIHNNLRAMYYGIFTQKMADEFIRYHLLNPREFWTPFPLPSIAADDPLFRNDPENDWSGQPEGLTYQRAIRALENYGHYSLVTQLGEKLIDAVERGGNRFTQQFDPFTGRPSSPGQDGYGPTMLAVLEYISRMHGVHADLAAGQVWWSACDGKDFTYTQRWGGYQWVLASANKQMTAWLNGRKLFRCTVGVRVVTDLDGRVTGIAGIAASPQDAVLELGAERRELTVAPDSVNIVKLN